MAIANTETLLSLDQYAEVIGANPWNFNQIVSETFPDEPGCSKVWFQHGWTEAGKASREELADSIAQAEQMIARLIGFWPAPKWVEDEVHHYPRRRRTFASDYSLWAPGYSGDVRKSVKLDYEQVTSVGHRKVELLAENVLVTYTSPDGDHFEEMATVQLIDSEASTLDPTEVAVFPGTDTSPSRQIRNLRVTTAGDVTKITGWSAYFADPTLWDHIRSEDGRVPFIDGDMRGSYLTKVNVYRVYPETMGKEYAPAVFEWESSYLNAYASHPGLLQVTDAKRGIVSPVPAVWDDTEATWRTFLFASTDEPHRVRTSYRAGWPVDSQGKLQAPFAKAVAALASALLVKPICGCDDAYKLVRWWQETPMEGTPVSFEQLNCPFGPKRGAYEAYTLLSRFFTKVGAVNV